MKKFHATRAKVATYEVSQNLKSFVESPYIQEVDGSQSY